MNEMKLLLVACLVFSANASAQIYRWVDAEGRVNFSNSAPPQGVQSMVVDPDAKEGPPQVDSGPDCHTLRCQGERLEERQQKREAHEEKKAAERAALAPKPVRGLEFRKYVNLQQGMTEGELLGIAGEPDLMSDQGVAIAAPAATVPVNRNFNVAAREGLVMKTYTYLPTSADPFTTTITMVGGRISDMDRVRKF